MKNWHTKYFPELTVTELYGILRLRAEVFVVEQDCPYQDLDGLDQVSLHLWMEEDGRVVAYARLLPPGTAYEQPGIGRVVVAMQKRNTKLGVELMRRSLEVLQGHFKGEKVVIMAQSYLLEWYQQFGFVEVGEEFLEDGIPHRIMELSTL